MHTSTVTKNLTPRQAFTVALTVKTLGGTHCQKPMDLCHAHSRTGLRPADSPALHRPKHPRPHGIQATWSQDHRGRSSHGRERLEELLPGRA
jgi:hypothetical protein